MWLWMERPEVTDDMGSSGMRAFFRIAETWGLSPDQGMVLLGRPVMQPLRPKTPK